MSKIYEIFGIDAHQMTISLMEAAKVAELIPISASVALKPNLVLAGTPDTGATTHAGVLSGCIEYLQEHGFEAISVIESSWVGDTTLQQSHRLAVAGHVVVAAERTGKGSKGHMGFTFSSI